MALSGIVPIVQSNRATTAFKAAWRQKIAVLALTNLPIPDSMGILTQGGLPSKEFAGLWKSVFPKALNSLVPMVTPSGTPTPAFLKTWESF